MLIDWSQVYKIELWCSLTFTDLQALFTVSLRDGKAVRICFCEWVDSFPSELEACFSLWYHLFALIASRKYSFCVYGWWSTMWKYRKLFLLFKLFLSTATSLPALKLEVSFLTSLRPRSVKVHTCPNLFKSLHRSVTSLKLICLSRLLERDTSQTANWHFKHLISMSCLEVYYLIPVLFMIV